MDFQSNAYGAEINAVLALDGNGNRPMALAGGSPNPRAQELLRGRPWREVFGASRHPQAAMSGLWLYFSDFEESHALSQSLSTVEGSLWHGILHRREPDAANASYWFKRAGVHAIFPMLRREAEPIVKRHSVWPEFQKGGHWDAVAFVAFCESAGRQPGSPAEQAAKDIQLREWQLLFHYCAETAA